LVGLVGAQTKRTLSCSYGWHRECYWKKNPGKLECL
jgi:hypothetical protein